MPELRQLGPRRQELIAIAPFHSWNAQDGGVWAAFYRTPFGFLIRFPNLADFEVSADGAQVTGAPAPGVSAGTLEHLYLNQVLPMALSMQGALVYHGSAVALAGGAIAFLGASGRGKSTLATAFAVKNHGFLTDDALILKQDRNCYLVHPSHPSVRLWEDSQRQLLEADVAMAPAVAYTPKARLLAGEGLAYCDQPRRLLAVFFLGEDRDAGITLERLSEAATVMQWAKNSFLLDVDDKSLVSGRFEGAVALAKAVPGYCLSYPRRYADLDRVVAAVCAQVPASRQEP